jgi:hypothetical protein
MHLERTVKSALHRLADASREVNIRCVDHEPCIRVLDCRDAVKRVLGFFASLLVPGETDDDLRLALPHEGAMHGQNAGRQPIPYPTARGTELLMRNCRL